jgi:hypothetical protein
MIYELSSWPIFYYCDYTVSTERRNKWSAFIFLNGNTITISKQFILINNDSTVLVKHMVLIIISSNT